MVRYIFVWLVIAAVIYGFRYLITQNEEKELRKTGNRVFVSCSIAGVIVLIMYFLNNIQGI